MPASMDTIVKRWMEPDFKFFVNRSSEERNKMLLKTDAMKDEYLGACLDYARMGFMNGTWFPFSARGMIHFVQRWMELNKDNLQWSEEPIPSRLKLPYIDYAACPRDKDHKRTVKDIAGRLRCGHVSEKKFKPSFIRQYATFDPLAAMDYIKFIDDRPENPLPIELEADEEEYYAEAEKNYMQELQRYLDEEPITIYDQCYAIISDKGQTLPLQTVLLRLHTGPNREVKYCNRRLDSCRRDPAVAFCLGHTHPTSRLVFPFSGWELAWYVQKWHEQLGNKSPFYTPENQEDHFKKYPDFVPISSDD